MSIVKQNSLMMEQLDVKMILLYENLEETVYM